MFRLPLFVIIALISGCVPMYVPMRHNVPMHSGKNEFQGSVSIIQGLNVQTAYSITNHFGVTCNYLYANNKSNNNDEFRAQRAGEAGIGYYSHFDKNWWVETYIGYGFGSASAFGYDFGDEYSASGKYQKFYFQPSVGFRGDELISNFSFKFSHVDFTELKVFVDGVEEIPAVNPKIFFAPIATVNFPLLSEHLYGTVQVGYNIAMGKDPAFDYEPFMGSVGLLLKVKTKKVK